MSAIGTKRTSACALQMSAVGGKADMCFWGALTQSGVECTKLWLEIARPSRASRSKADHDDLPTAHSTFRFYLPTRLSKVREANEPIWYRAGKARSRIAYVHVP